VADQHVCIEALALSKRYGRSRSGLLAVDDLRFEVYTGEVFGFLGPNGAGKTTTLRMLTGLSRPSAGAARVLDMDLTRDIARIKKQIGVVPESSNLYAELTAYENLVFSMRLYGMPRAERGPRAEELLARFRLSKKRDTAFAKLSRGQKRALTIAAALAHRPALLYLDEPTTGLDVVNARNLRKRIAQLRDEGVTVFLTTHFLEEAERLCDRIALIVRGKIVALDTVDGLKARVEGTTIVEVTTGDGNGGIETRRLVAEDVGAVVRRAVGQVAAEGRQLLSVNTVRPSFEDVFVQLTGLSADVLRVGTGRKGG